MTVPATVGRYQVVGRLASGGMAEILLGKLLGPSGFERAVVIKRILPHLATEERFVTMFLDEARIVAKIRHPNVVQVHELGRDGDDLFLVMEYLDGESAFGLMKRLRHMRETLPYGLAAHIVAEACAGLHAAHELRDDRGYSQSLVHRDVSPQNVMVLYDGQVKVLDFGVAKGADSKHNTEAGQIKGKFAYMSPEQCRTEPLDRRSDVFSLGTVLFELTTGRRLFARDGDLQTLKAIIEEPVIAPTHVVAGYPRRLEAICMRALSRLREDRYQTALEMRRDLLAALREIVADPVPEDVLGRLMTRIFADRIEEKQDMLKRIRAGSQVFAIPAREADLAVELPVASEGSNIRAVGGAPASVRPSAAPSAQAPRWRAFAAGGTLAAVVAAGIFYFVVVGSKDPTPVALVSPAPPSHDPPADPLSSAAATTVPEPAPLPTTVRVELESTPPGAEVTLGDRVVGRTPASVEVPRGRDALALVLSLEGHAPYEASVVPDVDQRLTLALVPEASVRRTPAKARPAAPPTAMRETGEGTGFRRFD